MDCTHNGFLMWLLNTGIAGKLARLRRVRDGFIVISVLNQMIRNPLGLHKRYSCIYWNVFENYPAVKYSLPTLRNIEKQSRMVLLIGLQFWDAHINPPMQPHFLLHIYIVFILAQTSFPKICHLADTLSVWRKISMFNQVYLSSIIMNICLKQKQRTEIDSLHSETCVYENARKIRKVCMSDVIKLT